MEKHNLPLLPYELDALAPHISHKTMEFHYGKHLQTYLNNLNNLIAGSEYENMTLEEIVRKSEGPVFNNAAQSWNHIFFFEGLGKASANKAEPTGALLESIELSFGSFGAMKEQMSKAAVGQFGSGWAWLVVKGKELEIVTTSNAGTPLKEGKTPILCIDVWEHAYYLDYQNRRADYISEIWQLIDWAKIEQRFGEAVIGK